MKAAAAALLLALAALWPAQASAALTLCNHTSYILYAATAQQDGATMHSRGWNRLVPGSCTVALPEALGKQPLFVYAHSSHAHKGPLQAWGGDMPICVAEGDFSLTLPISLPGCRGGDAYPRPFARVDTHGKADWTMTFEQNPPLDRNAAEAAGLKRLLGDAGELKGDAAKSLAAFRARMRLPAGAGTAESFDALETEALGSAAPAGYAICNDTDAPIFAALALQENRTWHTRGWWQVAPGACAQAVTAPLATDAVYLLAEDKAGKKLVTGQEKFCIAQIAFDVEGRGDCAARGLTAGGFARTATKGQQGHAAHVGENGLVGAVMRGTE